MSLYEINPVKTLTIEALVNCSFPAIKATDDIALPFVGPRTVAYIHALIVDSVTVVGMRFDFVSFANGLESSHCLLC